MPKRINVEGLKFGRLYVIGDGPRNKNRRSVICSCDCGKMSLVDPRMLLSGHTKSCGCLQREAVSRTSLFRATHDGSRTPEYNTWIKMKMRCNNPDDKKYPAYGARGIKVCEAWKNDFARFLLDMGNKPSPTHSIDRIDVNGDYEPTNCRWATYTQQARNKRKHRLVEHDGRMMPLSEACEAASVNYRTALYRLNVGKPWKNEGPHG